MDRRPVPEDVSFRVDYYRSGGGVLVPDVSDQIWHAAARMRPTGLEGMEASSVRKKFKDKKFAAGCSRDIIAKGAEMLGMDLNELFSRTIEAMQA